MGNLGPLGLNSCIAASFALRMKEPQTKAILHVTDEVPAICGVFAASLAFEVSGSARRVTTQPDAPIT